MADAIILPVNWQLMLLEQHRLHSTMAQVPAWHRVSAVPLERWDIDAPLAGSDPHAAPARFGGWLRDAALFDTDLFGMAAANAARAIDPQQRLVLDSIRQAHTTFQARAAFHARLCFARMNCVQALSVAHVRSTSQRVPAVFRAGSRQRGSSGSYALDRCRVALTGSQRGATVSFAAVYGPAECLRHRLRRLRDALRAPTWVCSSACRSSSMQRSAWRPARGSTPTTPPART